MEQAKLIQSWWRSFQCRKCPKYIGLKMKRVFDLCDRCYHDKYTDYCDCCINGTPHYWDV